MIRSLKLPLPLLNAWLVEQALPISHPQYRLRVWQESHPEFAAIQEDVIAYIDEAFDDARRKVRRGFEDDMSPFTSLETDPAANYPALLNQVTLQGYLGEMLAVMAVEHWGALGQKDWCVPAMLFRTHVQEFQHLELINQRLLAGETFDINAVREMRTGRTGDDALAFRISREGKIVDVLTIEAKCVRTHNAETVREGHEKLSAGARRPTGIGELISLLADYESESAQLWQQALLELWHGGYHNIPRHDAISYATGTVPHRRITWLPVNFPHASYTQSRNLIGYELHLADIPTLLNVIFRGS